MRKLYVFGNEFLEEDKFSKEISKSLDGNYEIVNCRSPDELLEAEEDEILILDVVKGIKEPIIITDPKQIKTRSLISLHDFDVGFFLNLLKEMGINKKIKIIGVPQAGNEKEIVNEVLSLI